jgi:ankyrin repeat protein
MSAAGERGTAPIAEALLAQGAELDARDHAGATALMLAAARTKPGMLRGLIAKGAAVDAVDAGGVTALMRAAELGRIDGVEALMKAGADPSRRDAADRTAADFARSSRRDYIVMLLEAQPAR